MKKFAILYHWIHVEGHQVTYDYTKDGLIEAESTDDAIKRFKEKKPELGQYILQKGQQYYYGYLPTWQYKNIPLEIK
jgi:hypothetical protein